MTEQPSEMYQLVLGNGGPFDIEVMCRRCGCLVHNHDEAKRVHDVFHTVVDELLRVHNARRSGLVEENTDD